MEKELNLYLAQEVENFKHFLVDMGIYLQDLIGVVKELIKTSPVIDRDVFKRKIFKEALKEYKLIFPEYVKTLDKEELEVLDIEINRLISALL